MKEYSVNRDGTACGIFSIKRARKIVDIARKQSKDRKWLENKYRKGLSNISGKPIPSLEGCLGEYFMGILFGAKPDEEERENGDHFDFKFELIKKTDGHEFVIVDMKTQLKEYICEWKYKDALKKSQTISASDKIHFTKKSVAEKSDIIIWSSCEIDKELRLKALFDKKSSNEIFKNWKINIWGWSSRKLLLKNEKENTFVSVVDDKTVNIAIARKELLPIGGLISYKALHFPNQIIPKPEVVNV